MKHSVKFPVEIEKLAVVVHGLKPTQKLVISRCLFAEDGKEKKVPSIRTYVHSHRHANQNLLP